MSTKRIGWLLWRFVCKVLPMFLFSGPVFAEELSVKDYLEAYDQAFLSAFTVTLQATYPTNAFDGMQGSSTATVTIASDGTQQALRLESSHLDPLVFNSARIGNQYDDAGNYTISHHKAEYVHLGADSWKTRTDFEHFTISPQNVVLKKTPASPLNAVHPKGHPDPANVLFRYLLPLGRGFAQLVDEVVSVEERPSGISIVRASGTLFSDQSGTWLLEVDTTRDYLVQTARFRRDGADYDSVVSPVSSAGTLGAEIPLYREGSFSIIPSYAVSVRLTDYTRQATMSLIHDVQEAVNAVGRRSTILDFGRIDGDGMPLVLRGVDLVE